MGKEKSKSGSQQAQPSSTPPPERTPIHGASIDDLSARLGEIEGVSEDLATFLAHNWQRFVGALCVVLLAVVIFYQYRGTQRARLGEAATRYEDISKQLAKVSSPPADIKPEEKEKNTVAFFEQIDLLKKSQSGNIYGQLTGLYASEGFRVKGDFAKAEEQLGGYNWKAFENISVAKKSADVVNNSLPNEIAAMLFARLQLAKGVSDLTQVRKILKGIALGGRFLNQEALIILFRLSSSPEQVNESRDAAKALLGARPELKEAIDTQLEALGFVVSDDV